MYLLFLIKMTEVKPFSDIKKSVEDIVEKYVTDTFGGRAYDVKQAQKWSNTAAEDIIKNV